MKRQPAAGKSSALTVMNQKRHARSSLYVVWCLTKCLDQLPETSMKGENIVVAKIEYDRMKNMSYIA